MGNCGPLAATDSISATARARTSTSSPSRRRPRFRLAWKRTAPPPTRGGIEQAQRAFDWFLGWNDLGLELYARADRRLPRWAARGPEQRKPGSRIDAGLPPVAGGNAADTKCRDGRSTGRSGSLDHSMKQIDVKRSTVTLDPDRTHVLARPFRLMSDQRSIKIYRPGHGSARKRSPYPLGGGSGRIRRPPTEDRRIPPPADLTRSAPICSMAKDCPKNGSCCWADISLTSIRSKPRRCSIPRWCRTRISRMFRPARCVSS